jgi:CDP-diacylglycerol---serine O-phosphatidyltransferase
MKNYLLTPNNHFNLANLFTFVNITMGLMGIYLITQGNFFWAIVALWIGGAFDIFDGKIARKFNLSNEFGIQIDSFADFISFVMAPSFLIFQAVFAQSESVPLWLSAPVFIIYIISGLRRLIDFNINADAGEVEKYFTGVPTPLGAILLWIVYLVVSYGFLNLDFLVLLIVLIIAMLLNSKVKIRHP